MISSDKLICCGGRNYFKHVDIYDFSTRELCRLSDKNRQSSYSGIYADNMINHNVYVCGGEMSSGAFEYYDIIKDKWIEMSWTKYIHECWPIIWSDDNNPNIIYIGSIRKCKSFEQIDIRQNKWKKCTINNIEAFDNLFATNININDYHARLLLPHEIY